MAKVRDCLINVHLDINIQKPATFFQHASDPNCVAVPDNQLGGGDHCEGRGFVAGEIIQVIEAMPGSVVPLAMF